MQNKYIKFAENTALRSIDVPNRQLFPPFSTDTEIAFGREEWAWSYRFSGSEICRRVSLWLDFSKPLLLWRDQQEDRSHQNRRYKFRTNEKKNHWSRSFGQTTRHCCSSSQGVGGWLQNVLLHKILFEILITNSWIKLRIPFTNVFHSP